MNVFYDTTTDESSSAALLGSITDFTDPESQISRLLDAGSALVRFSEVLSRFLPL